MLKLCPSHILCCAWKDQCLWISYSVLGTAPELTPVLSVSAARAPSALGRQGWDSYSRNTKKRQQNRFPVPIVRPYSLSISIFYLSIFYLCIYPLSIDCLSSLIYLQCYPKRQNLYIYIYVCVCIYI